MKHIDEALNKLKPAEPAKMSVSEFLGFITEEARLTNEIFAYKETDEALIDIHSPEFLRQT